MTDYNAANRKDVRLAQKAELVAIRQRLDYTIHVMSTPAGRQWLWSILERCHVFANPFTDTDRLTAFSCGEMNIGQAILADIMTAAPDSYIQAMRESNDRYTASERARNADANGRDQGSGAGGDSTADYDLRDEDGNPASDGYGGNEARN